MKSLFALFLFFCFCFSISAQEQIEFTTLKEVPITSVKDQYTSGTCWSFSVLGLIEAELLRRGKDEYDFSEMFIVHKNYGDKAKKYIRMNGKINFGAGGSFADVLDCIRDYGIVPEEVQSGLNYGEEIHKHEELDELLKSYVDVIVKNPNKKISTAWYNGFNGILDAYLGKCSESFSYKGKSYTPQSFAQSLGIDPNNYISITSFTHHPFYTSFPMEVPDNWRWANSYNLPLNEMIQVIDNAIYKGYTVGCAMDISERGFNRRQGIASVPEKEITQEIRQESFDNYTTTDDHGMLIYGIAQDQNETKYYMVKNSWGVNNPYKGTWYISVPFVEYKTINILVHKNALPDNVRNKLKIE